MSRIGIGFLLLGVAMPLLVRPTHDAKAVVALQRLLAGEHLRVDRSAYQHDVMRGRIGQFVRGRLNFTGGSGPEGGSAIFDLTNGIVTASDVTVAASIEPGPFGFYRCTLNSFNTLGATAAAVQFERANSGDAAGNFEINQAGLTNRLLLGSPIPTTTAIVTRSADVASVTLGSWFNPTEGSFLIEAYCGGDPSQDQEILVLRNSDASANILVQKSHFGPAVQIASSTGATLTMYGVSQGSLQRIAFAYKAGTWSSAKTGGGGDYLTGLPTDTDAVPSGLTTMDLGHVSGAAQLTGALQRVIYFPQHLSDAALAALVN